MSIQASKKPNISHPSPISNFLSNKKKSTDKGNERGEMESGKILGIDYGASKVGLAMADSETRTAFSYTTLPNNKYFLQTLAELIESEDISKVIIGIPSQVNREQIHPAKHGKACAPSAQFNRASPGEKLGKLLEDKLKVKVEYQNEMFTTLEAQRNLIERGVKKIKRYDDQEAARLILQGWLDRRG